MLALVLMAFLADADPTPEMKIIARGPWTQSQANTGEVRTPKAIIVRKGEDLVSLTPYNRLDALQWKAERHWTATERDVAALYTAQFGPRDTGEEP